MVHSVPLSRLSAMLAIEMPIGRPRRNQPFNRRTRWVAQLLAPHADYWIGTGARAAMKATAIKYLGGRAADRQYSAVARAAPSAYDCQYVSRSPADARTGVARADRERRERFAAVAWAQSLPYWMHAGAGGWPEPRLDAGVGRATVVAIRQCGVRGLCRGDGRARRGRVLSWRGRHAPLRESRRPWSLAQPGAGAP